jgi:hypothetical protein
MNKIKLIFLLIIMFILINIIIVILWPIKNNLKLSNYNHYSEKFLKSLNLNQEDGRKLYLETWQRDRIFQYDEYTGIKESNSINAEFVNITDENGRLVADNPKQCSKNIFFYGGESVFGYDVSDRQTIPSYFSNLLRLNRKDYCVYNFGRGTYFSTQENILLQKHILNNRVKGEDIIIFIDGENEKGNLQIINTEFIKKNYNDFHQRYWKLYKVGINHFFGTLPITQFFQILNKKKQPKKNEKDILNKNIINEEEIFDVYNKNLKIRKAICDTYALECHNFLLVVDPSNQNIYDKLRTIEKIKDITKNFLWEKNEHGLFTPKSNEIISKEIYQYVLN